ncbi:hypothetical protein FE773_04230 [Caminibacter mediatlanticus TB-2]|uniref:ABC transporter permease n=1 Tax=Caminibacter mediatlanticus TB-2 TaxID=391592 RepID=A0ABX5VBE4_9BACT|nr:hypothetical protein [Caminibacter mediatlanticus]QCT94410.1 hypothetical protein FE773_04230 [Caminibacter mediatlanticus TB-2]
MKQISFILFFFLILSLKKIEYISIVLTLLIVFTYKDFFTLSKKVLKSIILFSGVVSIGYLIMGLFTKIYPDYLLYINLKVFTITYFVFWFFSKVNIVEFFSFNKEFSYLLTISLSQIYSYKKTFEDFRMAFKSRVINLREKEYDFIRNTFAFFFKKALNDAKEKSLAMKSRGFFEN